MKFLTRHNRKIAFLLAYVMAIQFLIPIKVYGLTSGPSQPEMKGFEPIGNSDMVDLFSGDFSYNIPLMDVGGYPVNLAYHSGASMDDEASWVGYGWSLNVGSVNRQLRGIPDDFNGTDKQEREMNMKDHVTKGAKFSMTLDLLGVPVDRIKFSKKKKKLNLSLTVSVGVKHDNYRGIGMELGLNTGLSLSEFAAGNKTPKDSMDLVGTASLGLGINLSSMDGATVSLNPEILRKSFTDNDKENSVSKSIGFGYNSRTGLAGMTLSNSFSARKFDDDKKRFREFETGSSSFISFNGETYTPTIDHPTKNNSFTFTLHLGPELWVALPAIGVTGFYSRQKISQTTRTLPAYGYMNSEKGKDISEALMDMNREKDIPYSNQVKYLPIPIPTNDLFTATSQDCAGQYRLYRGGSGIFFDNKTVSDNDDFSVGVEAGAGFFADAGADVYNQYIVTKTQKWTKRNDFLPKGDFLGMSSSSPLYEPAYFKRVGEPVPNDKDYLNKIKGTSPVAVVLPGRLSNAVEGSKASDLLRTKSSSNGESISTLKKDTRDIRNTTFSYLTAKEASNHGLEKNIIDYKPDSIVISGCSNANAIHNTISRTSNYRKAHHISEITITGDDGKRNVYGIPVYNTYQEEVTFSVNANQSQRNTGLVSYTSQDNSTSNDKGRENYYSKEKTPPYATSYLLTAILSPDYVDRTGNGISDDDLGTAVKFNYTKLDSLYRWRTPFAFGADTANYNEGFLSDLQDDKANYVYGEKEIWYLHSIESKTMVAQFITENRDDGLGVINNHGAVDTASTKRLKRLKEIRLYSKSDLKMNGNDPSRTIPIKVVHFVYDYSICKGLPNSINHGGKLTLQRVYFTFGQNRKGILNPYEFQYDTTYNFYNYRQYDRWGNFKDLARNPGGLNNSEFPYTIQDTSWTNPFARAWQMNKIILPSGGSINISYESDDYAFVQDKRASQMCMLNGVGSQGSATGLISADYIYINLPYAVSSQQEMMDRYFDGVSNLYYKFLLDLDGKGHKEFVPGYAPIDSAIRVESTIAKIKLKKQKGINPIARSGWQFIRTNLPKYAYPGSENLEDQGTDLKKAIKALLTAVGNIKELVFGFEKRAKKKGFSNAVDTAKSFVRLCSPTWKKLGGGSRVRRIDISDDWATMSGASGAQTTSYSQIYDYTTKDPNGRTISSGVASYEPMLGNDENPFRQPIRYKQSEFLGLNNYYYIEEPFCESLFPAANVGYSKVTVKSIGSGDAESVNRNGTVISEFFTAKDYPTKVDVLGLEQRKPLTNNIFKLIGAISYDILGLSQGYSIELNDMHGKPKSVNVFNKSGQNISSVEYFYKTTNELSPTKELNNSVKVIHADGTLSDETIGMDAEVFTDMREQTTENAGASLKVSGGSGAILIFPLPFFFPGFGINYELRSYRASSSIKIINRFAIQYKVKKTENGSSITTENLLWDAETGNVLLTKTQNEFDDPIYSFAYPAHWFYNRMGQAYQNLGTVLSSFTTASDGTISNSTYNSLLVPGDELIDINSSNKYWIINSPVSSSYQKRLIDTAGNIKQVSSLTLKLIRSGRRNMANTAIATIVSLNNPIAGDRLDVSQLTKILDAKATVFNEEWSVPVLNRLGPIDGTSCGTITSSCLQKFLLGSMVIRGGDNPAYFYSTTTSPPVKVSTILDFAYGSGDTACRSNFLNGLPDTAVTFYQYHTSGSGLSTTISSHDSAQLDGCKMYFDSVNSKFNELASTFSNVDSFDHFHRIISGTSCLRHVVVEYDPDSCKATVTEEPVITLSPLVNPCYISYFLLSFRIICPSTDSACLDPVGRRINPYYAGILGNWRPQSQYAYHVSRENFVSDPAKTGSTDIRKSGAYSIFSPFWKYDYTYSQKWAQINKDSINNVPYSDSRWIEANKVTNFNLKGLELENKDALNRYSSAQFGYLESMPIAVASNSQFREIGYDGFEDYGFNLDCASADTCNKTGHFNFRALLNGSTVDTTQTYAHSGKYSLKLHGSVTLAKTVYTGVPDSFYSFDNSGRYILESNELTKGFSPIPGKKYVLSFWVYDGSPRDPTTNIQAKVNGTNLVNSSVNWPIVEGWKRVEVQFVLSSMASSFSLEFNSGSGTYYIDDVRIHPFDGQMKSFAYDPSSQRLMAELDENNFATFYEYDDEGILIRVKKETEKGIMTIKETRSAYRKRN